MTENDPAVLLARSANLKLFVMLRQVGKPDLLEDNLGAHLRWLIDREKEGVVFMSGPVKPRDGKLALSGLTLIRAEAIEEAEALAEMDPFIKLGIFTYEMREWTVKEGSLHLSINLSDSSVSIVY